MLDSLLLGYMHYKTNNFVLISDYELPFSLNTDITILEFLQDSINEPTKLLMKELINFLDVCCSNFISYQLSISAKEYINVHGDNLPFSNDVIWKKNIQDTFSKTMDETISN